MTFVSHGFDIDDIIAEFNSAKSCTEHVGGYPAKEILQVRSALLQICQELLRLEDERVWVAHVILDRGVRASSIGMQGTATTGVAAMWWWLSLLLVLLMSLLWSLPQVVVASSHRSVAEAATTIRKLAWRRTRENPAFLGRLVQNSLLYRIHTTTAQRI